MAVLGTALPVAPALVVAVLVLAHQHALARVLVVVLLGAAGVVPEVAVGRALAVVVARVAEAVRLHAAEHVPRAAPETARVRAQDKESGYDFTKKHPGPSRCRRCDCI